MMGHASSLEFISDNHQFGVKIEQKEVLHILQLCKLANGKEVGGIIVGRYDRDHRYALVKAISEAPSDSIKTRRWFQRGIQGLQRLLDQYWYGQQYFYLGEWHFHPNHSAQASSPDIEQMRVISASTNYNCPEPILLICGGEPCNVWEINAYVFPRYKAWIRLRRI